jgi:hypothetical protein
VLRERKVRRFDLACALESAFEQNDWKGDSHCRGVFFTDQRGYCLNKVLAIRIEHEEEAPDVFYSFNTSSIENKVVAEYPFKDMEVKPKKHHLLLDRKDMKKEDMDRLFVLDSEYDEVILLNTDILEPLISKLPNKRERERTQIHFMRTKNNMRFDVVRYRKNQKEIVHKKECTPVKYFFHEGERGIHTARANANTLHTVLQIFPMKSEVCFRFAHDRIKITGNLSTLEGKQARVEIVLAQMKG